MKKKVYKERYQELLKNEKTVVDKKINKKSKKKSDK